MIADLAIIWPSLLVVRNLRGAGAGEVNPYLGGATMIAERRAEAAEAESVVT